MPRDPEALFKEAKALEASGLDDRAQDVYFAVLEIEPRHFGALNNLGNLFARRGLAAAALASYREAIKWHPGNCAGHVNLGAALLDAGEIDAACDAFTEALRLDTTCAEAHQGLSAVLAHRGDVQGAARHRRLGFADRAVVREPYRGEGTPLAGVLLLLSTQGGNVDLRHVLDDRRFAVSKLFVDVFDRALPLPAHNVVVNAIGDADLCGDELSAAEEIAARTQARVLNAPAVVRLTGRAQNAERLAGISGLVAPRTRLFERDALSAADLHLPILLRTPGRHTGEHLVRVSDASELPAALGGLPGSHILAIEFLDARGPDENVRKYRVMFVGGQLYPLHLAISKDWMVHYFASDNLVEPAHRDEEARFLADMPETLGSKALGALESVRDALQLDYGGIDFGLDRDGNVLLFEANATMTIPHEPTETIWSYRRAAIHRVLDAVESLIALSVT